MRCRSPTIPQAPSHFNPRSPLLTSDAQGLRSARRVADHFNPRSPLLTSDALPRQRCSSSTPYFNPRSPLLTSDAPSIGAHHRPARDFNPRSPLLTSDARARRPSPTPSVYFNPRSPLLTSDAQHRQGERTWKRTFQSTLAIADERCALPVQSITISSFFPSTARTAPPSLQQRKLRGGRSEKTQSSQ